MITTNRFQTLLLCVGCALASSVAFAQDRPYTEGAVVNVARIRTETGRFDDYMKYVTGVWKAEQEASKKLGYITDYQVVVVEPRSESDPDLLLITYYKNWAALDGSFAKGDAVAKMVEGSVDASNQAGADRNKIRRFLGSTTMQVLNLK